MLVFLVTEGSVGTEFSVCASMVIVFHAVVRLGGNWREHTTLQIINVDSTQISFRVRRDDSAVEHLAGRTLILMAIFALAKIRGQLLQGENTLAGNFEAEELIVFWDAW